MGTCNVPTSAHRLHAMPVAAAAVLGYFAGTLPSADIASTLKARAARSARIDLRQQGTGNPGGLNAAKVLGTRWGLAVMATDFAKGTLASWGAVSPVTRAPISRARVRARWPATACRCGAGSAEAKAWPRAQARRSFAFLPTRQSTRPSRRHSSGCPAETRTSPSSRRRRRSRSLPSSGGASVCPTLGVRDRHGGCQRTPHQQAR